MSVESLESGVMPREVPAYRIDLLSEKTSRFLLCVFVINEGERIRRQLQKMQPFLEGVDCVIADGGSTDGSLELGFLRSQRIRALLTKTGPGRLSAQMRMALSWGLEQGYEGFIVMDGNDKDDPSALHDFSVKLSQGYDHVQGSRYIPGGQGINTPAVRHWAVKLIHAPLISLAAGRRCTDTTNGFRAYSARMINDARIAPFRDVFSDYELHYYLCIRSARLGFSHIEIPVTREYPAGKKAPTKISPLKGNLRVLNCLWKTCIGAYNP